MPAWVKSASFRPPPSRATWQTKDLDSDLYYDLMRVRDENAMAREKTSANIDSRRFARSGDGPG